MLFINQQIPLKAQQGGISLFFIGFILHISRGAIALPLVPSNDSTGPIPITVAALSTGLCTSSAPRVPVAELTIVEAHAAMQRGIQNCSALVEAYLNRIAAFDTRTQLNAISKLNPEIEKETLKLDKVLNEAKTGNKTLENLFKSYPLFCVPLLIKENIDVYGMPTTAGSVALAQKYPPKDAVVVGKLKNAGALVLAKTHMGELAQFPDFCISSLGGAVRNPYHLSYTSGGSSGGSAAGIAGGFALAALGTDTGNSARGPASHTALVGFRPSIGRISRNGVFPLRWDRDTVGPMGRSVQDVAFLFNAMQGFDPGDNLTLIYDQNKPKFDIKLDINGLKGAKIGVFNQIAEIPSADAKIRNLFATALLDLSIAGADLVQDFRITGNSMGKDWDANRDGEGPATGHWYAAGRWQDLWGCQWPIRAAIDEYLEIALSHNHTVPANLKDLYNTQLYHPLTAPDLHAAVFAPVTPSSPRGSPCTCGDPDPCRVEFRRNLVESMDRIGVDVLVYPTWNRQPLLVGDLGDRYYNGNNSPMIAPHVGAPAITVPMGYIDAGLPAGLQLLARPFDDAKLLNIAYAYEQATKHRRPPPLFRECSG